MRLPSNRIRCLKDAIVDGGASPSSHFIGVGHSVPMSDLLQSSPMASAAQELAGRSVLIASTDPFLTALALIELDGLARRMVLCPPDLVLDHLPYVMRHAEVDAVVSDGQILAGTSLGPIPHWELTPNLIPGVEGDHEPWATEWVLLTSGTTGRPKMVQHTLASLSGAITPGPSDTKVVWGTFYDIRRYGGLQIYLRAVLTSSSLLLAGPGEPVASFLQRVAAGGVTHISGTPSHWRRALMSPESSQIAPGYIRLSGEISDQAILNSLHSVFPNANISHAFATTEAGVAFDVRDMLSGFPANVLTETPGVELQVVDSTLRVRSSRTAARYLGENVPILKNSEGFVDTGDSLELRDGRYYFQGRRDGIINVGGLKVHPEEVEAVINRHPQVQLSLVKTKKNPITGALVAADVVLKDTSTPMGKQALELQQTITNFCRQSLAPHKVPAAIRFVPSLAISETGKLVRYHA